MDQKELSLYLEEQREDLMSLNKGINNLSKLLERQIKNYQPPSKNINVRGAVKVNTQKAVEVTNLENLQVWLWDLGNRVSEAISDNKVEPVKEISVKNIQDAKQSEIKITNFKELSKFFDQLNENIQNLPQPYVNVEKQDIVFPTTANKPISVRLSDGKSFYNAVTAFSDANRVNTQSIVNELQIVNSLTPSKYDYIDVAYPTSTQEIYTFKSGGSGGTTVSTITVNYVSSTKDQISNVARS